MSLYGLFYRIFLIATELIPYRVLYQIGKLMGLTFYLIPNKHKRISLENLNLVFPDLNRKELNKLLKESDYLAIACPSTPATYNMINKKSFQIMKSNSVIINTSRLSCKIGPPIESE